MGKLGGLDMTQAKLYIINPLAAHILVWLALSALAYLVAYMIVKWHP